METSRPRSKSRELKVGVRCWVECGGHVLLGRGRAELLAGIERCRSIAAAARAMGMSYRRAWLLVRSMNDAAGEPVVATASGGLRGGGAELTQRGRDVLDIFQRLDGELRQAAASSLDQITTRQSSASGLPHHVGPASRQAAVRRARKRR